MVFQNLLQPLITFFLAIVLFIDAGKTQIGFDVFRFLIENLLVRLASFKVVALLLVPGAISQMNLFRMLDLARNGRIRGPHLRLAFSQLRGGQILERRASGHRDRDHDAHETTCSPHDVHP